MIRVFLFIVLLLNLSTQLAWSQDGSYEGHYDEAQEAEISLRAKKRQYAGGRDEEDLKVQPQLSTPARKLAPQAEVKDEPAEE